MLNQFQSILIFCRFCICKSAHSLKFMCTPQMNPHSTLVVNCRQTQRGKICCPKSMPPAEVEGSKALPPHISSPVVNRCPFCHLLSAMFYALLYLLLMIRCYKGPPSVALKCSLVFLRASVPLNRNT